MPFTLHPGPSFVSNLSSLSTSVREPAARDEHRIAEFDREINLVEPIIKAMCVDLEHSPLTSRYVSEIHRVWELLQKSHANSRRLADLVRDQVQALANNNAKLTVAAETSKGEQRTIDKLTQEVQRALRMVDTAHTREQVAQETIENLRQQISRLHSELEAKSRLSSDQDGDFSSMAKTKEAQAKERERMVAEISSLRERLNAALSYQEELERKNSSADLQISELKQDLENQINEMSKESRFKERFEDDLVRVKKELGVKESHIAALNDQALDTQIKMTQLQNSIKEMKSTNEKQSQMIENLNQRLMKSQEEYQREVGVVDELKQTITVLNNQIKTNEEEIGKLVTEVSKTSNIQESFKKKLNKIEGQKNALAEQKAKLVMELQEAQRSLKDEQRKAKEQRMTHENTLRERDIINNNLKKVNLVVSEKERMVKVCEQAKTYLDHEMDNRQQEITRQAQQIVAIEKERDRYAEEVVSLTKELGAAVDMVAREQTALQNCQKALLRSEAQLAIKITDTENVRYELNTCSKNLNEAQEDIIEYKHKAKVMTLQIEQLKEDITGKETQLMREQLALRKAHAEKEAMRVETCKVEDQLKESQQTVTTLQTELASLTHTLREADQQHDRDCKTIEQLTNAREVINGQLVRRNDEVAVLREKTKTLQHALDTGEGHYSQRLDDIRILKLEVQRLSSEKEVLSRTLTNMADLRAEIHHLEKDLTKERLKARALEEELQNPLNIHRWRKLEGSDPAKLELVQKVKAQQKRMLEQADTIVQTEERCAELERRHEHLEQMLARYQHEQPERDRAEGFRHRLTHTDKRLKYLLGDLEMRMDQINELKTDLDKINIEMNMWKEKYYEQKKIAEKLKGKVEEKKGHMKKSPKGDNVLNGKDKADLPPIPGKPRFLGGGFNLSTGSTQQD